MRRTDPLRGVPVAWRLWGAVALCIAPLGTVWSSSITPGTTLYGDCGYSDGPYCVGDAYLPGSTNITSVAQSPARVFLFAAILVFAIAALRPRTEATRRLAGLAAGGLVIAAVLAANAGARVPLLCCVLALVLTVPVIWGRPNGGILAPGGAAR